MQFSSILTLGFATVLCLASGLPSFAAPTGPNTDEPKRLLAYCMEFQMEDVVLRYGAGPEAAIASAYESCKLELDILLGSLPSDDARTAFHVQVKDELAVRFALAKRMTSEEWIAHEYQKFSSETDAPANGAIGSPVAFLATDQSNQSELPKHALKHYDPNKLFAMENTVGCRWQDDLSKWFKLYQAGRRDLADQLECVVVEKGTELLMIENGFLVQAVLLQSDSATEYWFGVNYVADAKSRAIREHCPDNETYEDCSSAISAQYTTEAN